MFGRTVLCIYDNQPTDQSRQRNNTKRSFYHRQRTTNHYPTQNEGNSSDDNYSDSENESKSENQQKQQQQETATTTINENEQQNQAENQDQKQKETTNSQQHQENVTIRKHKTTPTTQYQINKEPPPKTTENYAEIQKATVVKENKPSTPQTQQQQQQQQNDTTIIPETQIVPQTQTQETTQISFHSPSMVTKNRYQILNSPPETIDIATPESNEPNTKETTSTPTPQHEQHQKAKTFAMRLYRMNFADTGSFLNATLQEKENLTALTMYYTLGDYDPSNKFIKTFRNKDIIDIYKIITEAKTTKTNILSRIYKHLNAINNRVEQRKLAKKKQQQKNTLKVILNTN